MTQDVLDAYWSSRAPQYAADQHRPGREADLKMWQRIWAGALPTPPARVVDVGTGSGYVAHLLHGLGFEVTGVDSAPGMLAEAARRGDGPRFVLGDALDPPVESEADAVTARYVLWTMRDPAAAVQAWHRLLRPGGRLVLVDGLWFPTGLPERDDAVPAGFAAAYRAAPPLASATDIEDYADVLREAEFADVSVTLLEDVLAADRTYGVPDGHHVTPQYLLTGTRSG